MFKKDSLTKAWKMLSTVSSMFLVYKQVKALTELSEEAQGYLSEADKAKLVNPLKTVYSQQEQVGTGV